MKSVGKDYVGLVRKHGLRFGVFALSLTACATVGMVYARQQDGPVGKVTQGLIGGKEVPASTQEDFGLVSISDSCSGSLLRNGWVVTAAHCVETGGGSNAQMPDPARPGQNVLDPIGGIRIKANWREMQERKAVRVETFRPYDVAIIQTDAPFKVHGSTSGFAQLVSQDGQFPHWGENVGTSMVIFGRGIHALAQAGPPAVPAQQDGKFRIGYIRPNRQDATSYYFSGSGALCAGGDSGGPSFVWTLNGYALTGVHSFSGTDRVPGKPTTGWDWVSGLRYSADAPVKPVWDRILAVIGPAVPPPQPPGFIGTFAKTPPNYQPLWLYGIRPNGEVIWYRKDTNASAWQGPRKVADGWNSFKDVIAAGGNRFYALTNDNKLFWFQHDGFNDGSETWASPRKGDPRIFNQSIRMTSSVRGMEIGRGWTFKRIFSGGEGIIYAIRHDGKLIQYRHTGLTNGSFSWADNGKEVGSDWAGYKDVFSTGKGAVYVVKWDGTLLLFQQNGYSQALKSWQPARVVGSGWQNFQQIVPAGDGVILAITYDGKLNWYRHLGLTRANRLARFKETWEGPVTLGTGWQDFGKVVSLIPLATPPVVR